MAALSSTSNSQSVFALLPEDFCKAMNGETDKRLKNGYTVRVGGGDSTCTYVILISKRVNNIIVRYQWEFHKDGVWSYFHQEIFYCDGLDMIRDKEPYPGVIIPIYRAQFTKELITNLIKHINGEENFFSTSTKKEEKKAK